MELPVHKSVDNKISALRIRQMDIAKVIPYARNPRKNAAAVSQVAASLKEFGWQQPIVVDGEHVIIAGHTRHAAAQALGMLKVPVVIADGLSDAQVKAYRLTDNRVAEDSEWDMDLLKLEISDLEGFGFDLELTGFSESELAGLRLSGDGNTDEDDAPEPPVDPVSKSGDVWCCGKHRIMCGDSTDAEMVSTLLGDVQPSLMVTDPPYGVEYDADWRNRADRANGQPYGASAVGKVSNDNRADWREAWKLFSGDVAYVWHADRHASETQNALEDSGFEIRCQVIWAKNRFAISRGDYHWQHEPCWYAVRKKGTGHWQGDRSQTTLWNIDSPHKSETGHSTQKPVECMRRPILNNSSPGQAIYDPFLGSGTTVIAAETEGRTCFGMEINPAYVDVSVKRWEEFTGEKAKLENG